MDWPTAVVLFPSRYRGDGGADYLHQWSFLDEGLWNVGNHNETRDTGRTHHSARVAHSVLALGGPDLGASLVVQRCRFPPSDECVSSA